MSLVLSVFLALASARRHAVTTPSQTPPCSAVSGTPAVAFTHDEGRFVTRPTQPLQGIGYTYGLAALDTPHTLLSWHKDTVSISGDDGCSWHPLGQIASDFPPAIVAANGGRAYAWSDARAFLVRYDSHGLVSLKPPGAIIGLGADASDGAHLRAGTTDGAIWESHDSGDSWTRIGGLAAPAQIYYRTVFDAVNLDHIVTGTAVDGAFVSRDGGKSWAKSLSRANVFNLAMAPSASTVVWAEGLDLDTLVHHIYLSRDGGSSFQAVVDEVPGVVTLVNGAVLAVHPTDPNVLYFVFGTSFQNYGTDLFRYDALTNALTVAHNDFDDIDSIAFSRSDPGLMYLGLETQRGIQ